MPATSLKQKRFMDAAAHNPAFAKAAGVPQKVAKEYSAASKGQRFAKGGDMASNKSLFKGKETPAEEKAEARALKAGKISPKQYVAGEAKEGHGAGAASKAKAIKSGKLTPAAYAQEHSKGPVKKMARGGGVESKGKTKGRMC